MNSSSSFLPQLSRRFQRGRRRPASNQSRKQPHLPLDLSYALQCQETDGSFVVAALPLKSLSPPSSFSSIRLCHHPEIIICAGTRETCTRSSSISYSRHLLGNCGRETLDIGHKSHNREAEDTGYTAFANWDIFCQFVTPCRQRISRHRLQRR